MNLDLIRKKLTQIQSTNQKSDRLWKPKPGKTVIRIVPYQYNKDYPFIEMLFHYGMGKKSYLSPSMYGKPDPIVEFSDKLKKSGSTDDWKLGKKMEPKLRIYAPILVRGEEKDGVKFWGFGKQIYQEILSFIDDADYGDITDLKAGRDLVVEFQDSKEAGNSFGKTSIRVKPNTSRVTEEKEVLEAVTNNQVDLNTLFPELSYDELKDVLEQWLNPSSDTAPETSSAKQTTDEDDAPAVSSKKSSPAASKTAAATTVSQVDDAFDELFKD